MTPTVKHILSFYSTLIMLTSKHITHLTVTVTPISDRAVADNEAPPALINIIRIFCNFTRTSEAVKDPLSSGSSSLMIAEGAEIAKTVLDHSAQKVIKPMGSNQIQLKINQNTYEIQNIHHIGKQLFCILIQK